MPKLNGLSDKQEKFCVAYLENGGNGYKAALEAGYPKDSARMRASENIRKNSIVNFLKARMENVEQKIEITIEKKMKMLMEGAEKCLQGEATTEGLVHPSGLVACISELNKMQGHHAATKSISTNLDIQIDQERLEQLLPLYEKEF